MPALPARKSFDQMMRKALAKTTGPLVPKTMSVAEMICHGFYQCYKCHSVEIQHNGLLLPYCTRCGGEQLRWVPGIDSTGSTGRNGSV